MRSGSAGRKGVGRLRVVGERFQDLARVVRHPIAASTRRAFLVLSSRDLLRAEHVLRQRGVVGHLQLDEELIEVGLAVDPLQRLGVRTGGVRDEGPRFARYGDEGTTDAGDREHGAAHLQMGHVFRRLAVMLFTAPSAFGASVPRTWLGPPWSAVWG